MGSELKEATPAVGKVVITVTGGVACVMRKPLGVEVQIIDYDVDGVEESKLDRDVHGERCLIQSYPVSSEVDWYPESDAEAASIAKKEIAPGIDGFVKALNEMAEAVHQLNKSWWTDLTTGKPKERNVGELLMLTVSELAEAMEGHRKGLPDDKLPHRAMLEVELADAVIRILDMAGGLGLDLGGALVEKLKYNMVRADHKAEARLAEGGKKY